MHSRFDRFRSTPLGRQLEALIESPPHYIEFAVLSRVGVAAIAAVADEIACKFPEIEVDTTARQFCGAMVAEVMRRHGHMVVQARGRIGGELFTYGAVFSAQPCILPFPDVVNELAQMPARLSGLVASFPQSQWFERPAGTGFALVEHVCHMSDLDAIFLKRIKTMQATTLPVIESVDGVELARQHAYLDQDQDKALIAFKRTRARLCALLAKLSLGDLMRCGLRDGVRRMSIEDIVRELLDHDRTHCLEIDELRIEFELTHSPSKEMKQR